MPTGFYLQFDANDANWNVKICINTCRDKSNFWWQQMAPCEVPKSLLEKTSSATMPYKPMFSTITSTLKPWAPGMGGCGYGSQEWQCWMLIVLKGTGFIGCYGNKRPCIGEQEKPSRWNKNEIYRQKKTERESHYARQRQRGR